MEQEGAADDGGRHGNASGVAESVAKHGETPVAGATCALPLIRTGVPARAGRKSPGTEPYTRPSRPTAERRNVRMLQCTPTKLPQRPSHYQPPKPRLAQARKLRCRSGPPATRGGVFRVVATAGARETHPPCR